MSEIIPLRRHKSRLEHLYLVNYHSHVSKRWLKRWINNWQDKIPALALSELIQAVDIIKILDDFERKELEC